MGFGSFSKSPAGLLVGMATGFSVTIEAIFVGGGLKEGFGCENISNFLFSISALSCNYS